MKPSIGRKIWFHPAGEQIGDQPLDATIVYVHSDTLINISAHDKHGNQFPVQQVRLVAPGTKPGDPGENWCEWMPYQIQQAGNVEANKVADLLKK